MAKVTRISKSKIMCYDTCPYNYKLCYVDKKPMPIKPSAMSRGVNIHDIYDKINTGIYGTKISEAFTNAIEDYPESYEPIKNFQQFHMAISEDDNIVKPLMSEEKIYCPFDDIVIIMDSVYHVDGKNVLIDFKSGDVNELYKYMFELSLYVWKIEEKKKIKIDEVGIYFTDHHVLKRDKVDREQIEMSKLKVRTFKKSVENDIFPKRPKYPCKNCISYLNKHCGGK